jgi:hypothetical protein
MFPAKICAAETAVVFGIIIVSTWIATRRTASAPGYEDGRDPPAHRRVKRSICRGDCSSDEGRATRTRSELVYTA